MDPLDPAAGPQGDLPAHSRDRQARPGPAHPGGDERFGVCRPVCDGLWVRLTHTEHLLCVPTRQFPVSPVRAPFLRVLIFLTLPDL